MATNVTTDTSYVPTNLDAAATKLGAQYTESEDMVMRAYSLKEDASKTDLKNLAKELGVKDPEKATVRSLQLIAEQRFQHAGQMVTLFSNLLEKMNQLKERLINNIGR